MTVPTTEKTFAQKLAELSEKVGLLKISPLKKLAEIFSKSQD